MNDKVMRMAREAGWLSEYDSPTGFCAEAAMKFEALVRADEREACAKVCEDSVEYAGDTLAEAIRARGTT
jgi:hypothetical protein